MVYYEQLCVFSIRKEETYPIKPSLPQWKASSALWAFPTELITAFGNHMETMGNQHKRQFPNDFVADSLTNDACSGFISF